MLIVPNNLIPFRGFAAINLFGILFVRKGVRLSRRLLNHERIHSHQQLEMLVLPFYILYLAEWLVRFVISGFRGHRAYRAISFEREAYAHEADLDYLSRRPVFAQWRK